MGKKYRTERRRIDARRVHVFDPQSGRRRVLQEAPERDLRVASWASNGRRPAVGRGRGGKLVAAEGNHRIAAAAKGRKIDVDYPVEVGSKDDRGSGVLGMAVQLGMAA